MKKIKLGLSLLGLLVICQSFGQNTAVKTADGNWKVCLTVSQHEKDPDYQAVKIMVKHAIQPKKTSEVIMNNYKMTVAYNLKFKRYTVYNNKGVIILQTPTVAAARDAVKHTMYKALTGKSL
ncbi:MAG: hypothetical protein P8P29_09450 [Flavobacteriaceae bacterium]|nr:hypothetical protein [Flavobacteriaceae bacterium]